jgi:hypothetical protein
MDQPQDHESPEPTTVLDHLRPTVVVRRRIVIDVASAPRGAGQGQSCCGTEDEDEAPPSSVFAPEAYNLIEDEEEGPPSSIFLPPMLTTTDPVATPAIDPRPTIPVGPTIAVGALARLLGTAPMQLAAELVMRGFFEVMPTTILPRETARMIAGAFGRAVEDVAAEPPAARKRTARRAPAPKKRTASSRRHAA